MNVRELIKELIEFNPDANVHVWDGSKTISNFTLAWGELSDVGMNKARQSNVTIYIQRDDNGIIQQEMSCKKQE